MADVYSSSGYNLLSINTSAHDGIAEGYRFGEFEYIGGALADFGECVADIGGAVDFASRLGRRIILQGHSLGCDRILWFALQENSSLELILLAPCDSYRLQTNWRFPETVEEQIQRLRSDDRLEEFPLLPWSEYGIRQGADWIYSIPVSRRTLLSIMEGPAFRLLRLDEPFGFSLSGRCLAYIGGKDRLQTAPEAMFRHIGQRTADFTGLFIDSGDHMLGDNEHEISARIVEWLRKGEVEPK